MRMRLDAGVTQAALAEEAAIDQGYLSQIERGIREPSLAVLQAVALALGADLSVRLYPNTGPTIRDRMQTPIVEALLRGIGDGWRRSVEVGVHHPVRGVIDVVLFRPPANLFVASEVESRIDRLEQEIRWAAQKADALPSSNVWRFAAGTPPPSISRLLLLRVTRATRELAMRYGEVLAAAYPANTASAYAAIHGSAAWPGSALLWADVTADGAEIRDRPPRGVIVGRGAGRAEPTAGPGNGSQP